MKKHYRTKPGPPKGVSNNYKGRPKMAPMTKLVQNLTRERFIAISNELMHKPVSELRELAADERNPALIAVVARILLAAMLDGDSKKLNDLLDRSIGKVIEKYEIVNKDAAENKDDFTPEELAQIAGGTSPVDILKSRLKAQGINIPDPKKKK